MTSASTEIFFLRYPNGTRVGECEVWMWSMTTSKYREFAVRYCAILCNAYSNISKLCALLLRSAKTLLSTEIHYKWVITHLDQSRRIVVSRDFPRVHPAVETAIWNVTMLLHTYPPHTHNTVICTVLTAIFPGELVHLVASFPFPVIPRLCILLEQAQTISIYLSW